MAKLQLSSEGPSVSEEPTAPAPAPAGDDVQRYEMSPELVTLGDAYPSEAEAIRTVRTHILARHLQDGRRGLAVCGPTLGVGCSFTAVNLAVSLSQVGVATLLIDGNLREPGIEEFIRPQTAAPGLKQCLEEDDHLRVHDFVNQQVLPDLSILYAGGVAPNAQELLAGDTFRLLIENCLRDFQFTIIDTPAANIGADARRISKIVGYSLIVARANVTLLGQLSGLAEQLQEDGARVVGTVLNEA